MRTVQVPGDAWQLDATILSEALDRSMTMRKVMLQYVHAMFNQVSQSAACNHFHTIEQRCCRWLLIIHDRVQSDRFILTQEFLGMMLGAQRTSITLAARKLKRQKLIDYSRGHVTILDRKALKQHSCECYAINKFDFNRLLGAPHGRATFSGQRH